MIQFKQLTKKYFPNKSNEVVALDSVDMHIAQGEMVALIGKSGAGKSTVLHIAACIDTYDDGEFYLDGVLVKGLSDSNLAKIRNSEVGIVMQDFALVDDFTALENVMIPLALANQKRKVAKKRAIELLKSLEIGHLANREVNKMSGGQKQRVAIARALVNEPKVILADEPTGSLDSNTSAEILGILKSLNKQGKTIVIVTHDLQISQLCERQIKLADGRIVG